MDDEFRRLVTKVDDHDRSLTLVSKVVEDINKNLERFADESANLRKEMTAHWSAQDKILNKMENVLERIASYEVRFQKIEERQISGCPNLLNFKEKHEGELAVLERRMDNIEDDKGKGMWLIITAFIGILVSLIQGFRG